MKKILQLTLGLAIMALLILPSVSLFSQDDENTYEVESVLKYWKEKYEITIKDQTFENVLKTVRKNVTYWNGDKCDTCSIIQYNMKTNDEGFAKGSITSNFCVIAVGDTAYKTALPYSVVQSSETMGHKQMPFIPGGKWQNIRIQFKFKLEENADETITITLKNAEMSGMEEYVTRKVHFWESNGLFETSIMEKIQNDLK